MGRTYGVVLAAGNARRMGENKMFMRIGKKSVLERTLGAFEESGCFDHIIIVCQKKDIRGMDAAARRILTGTYSLIEGGSERQFSVANALGVIPDADIVAVHDGARCFVTPGVIRACVQAARETGAAAAGVKTKDTIKTIEGDILTGTLDREYLVNIQTPQVFFIQPFEDGAREGGRRRVCRHGRVQPAGASGYSRTLRGGALR